MPCRKYIEQKKNLYHPKTRLWVFKKIHEWLNLGPEEFPKQKVFWVSGAAGTGKTVISAKLEDELGNDTIIAHHFCRHDLPKENSCMQILLSLGKLISKNLNIEEPYVNEEDINNNNIYNVFHVMLEKPLNNLKKNLRKPRKVIILDALDEIESGSLQEILVVITKYFTKLPDWIGIFITSRHQTNITDELSAKFETLQLHIDETKNLADIRIYILHLTQKYNISNDFQIEHLEREVEEEFDLKRNFLSGKLEEFKHHIQSCLTMYSNAIDEIKKKEPDLDCLVGKIEDFRDPSLKQDLDDFDKLYEQAKIAQKEFGGWLKYSFGKTHVVDPEVKGKERCKEKIRVDYDNDVSRIRDISRFTLHFDSFHDLLHAYKKVQQCKFAEVVQVKNKFSKPDTVGYRDINLSIKLHISKIYKLPSHVHISELQLQLNRMLQAKDVCHGYYEEIRVEIPKLLKSINTNIQPNEFERFISKRLHSPTIDVIVSKLMKKSSGLFQYAKLLEDTIAHVKKSNRDIEYDEIDALPTGLNDMYQVNFDRVFSSNDKEKDWEECKHFISLVCAAQEPLPKQIMMEILTKETYNDLQSKISLLFPEVNGKVYSIHKSVVDWLRRSKNIDENKNIISWFRNIIPIKNKYDLYYIDESTIDKAHDRLAGYFLDFLLPIAELSSKTQEIYYCYAMKYTIVHAHHSKNETHLLLIREKLLFSIEWLVNKITLIGAYECLEDYMLFSSIYPTDRPLLLMKHALRLSLPTLYKDAYLLCSQLLGGRLSMRYEKEKFEEIKQLLEDVNEYMVKTEPQARRDSYWKPSTQFLTPAGSPCEIILKGHTHLVLSVSFSPDGNKIASCSQDETVRIWNIDSGKCEKVLEGHTNVVRSVSFSPDGKKIASCSRDRTVRIWNIVSGKCEHVLEGYTDSVYSVSFSPDGKYLASGFADKIVRIWNIVNGKCEKVLEGHTSYVQSVAFSPDGSKIASCSTDKIVRIWNIVSGKCEKVFKGHTNYVLSVSFSPDGKKIASCSTDKTVRIWDVVSGKCAKVLEGHTHHVLSMSFSPDGKKIASSSWDSLRIWDFVSGKCAKLLEGDSHHVLSVLFSPNGKHVASCSRDRTVRIWNIRKLNYENVSDVHTADIQKVSFSPDGKKIASCSNDKTVRIWDVASGKCEQLMEGHTHYVQSVSFSPDGKHIASASADKIVRIWDIVSGKCEQILEGHTSYVLSVSFSPDGMKIASCSHDETIRIWDLRSRKCGKVLEGHTDSVYSVSFSPDGNNIASGGCDLTIRIWDIVSGKCKQVLEGHTHSVFSVSFSLDGKKIVSGCTDRIVRIWDLRSGKYEVLKGKTNDVRSYSFSPSICVGGDFREFTDYVFSPISVVLHDPKVLPCSGTHAERTYNRGYSVDGASPDVYFYRDRSICCVVDGSTLHILSRQCHQSG